MRCRSGWIVGLPFRHFAHLAALFNDWRVMVLGFILALNPLPYLTDVKVHGEHELGPMNLFLILEIDS